MAAHRIQQLENFCLASMLARLHEVEPGRRGGPNLVEDPRLEHLILELEELSGPRALWVPSWVERIRVREALWQIMTSCYSRMVPGMPTNGISRENREEWCAILGAIVSLDRDIIAGPWNRGHQRGDPFDCVYYTLWDVLGFSPMRLFTGLANRSEVGNAQDQMREVLPERLGFVADWDDTEPQPLEPVDGDDTESQPFVDDDGDVEMQVADVHGGHDGDGEPQADDTDDRDEGDVFGQSRRHIRCANYGTWFFILNYCRGETSGPINRQHFHAMSRLGLSVWDTRRLLALGLAQLPEGGYASPAARTADLKVRRTVWRGVFLREYNRVRGTPFWDEVTTERLRRDLDRWVTGEACDLLVWWSVHLLEDGGDIGERYDGPIENEFQRVDYDAVVVRMRENMRAERVAYGGELPVEDAGDGEAGDGEAGAAGFGDNAAEE